VQPIRRILIADSHPAIRHGLRVLLETRPGLEVVGASATAQEALEAALRSQPDLAIIDHTLSGLNGSLLALRLRAVAPAIQILIYTTLDDEQTIRDALAAGPSGFIRKSDLESDLFAAIDAIGGGDFYFSAAIRARL
jgi:DNA-binding NarL/FixJ family response regulator